VTNDRWVRVGDVASWFKGHGRQVHLDGAPIAVFWDGVTWTALDDTCPHMGASLADGRIYGDEVQCSWHDWRYNRKTGQCPVREWARVRVYPVRIEDGGVWIERPEPPSAEPTVPDDDDPEWVSWNPEDYFKKHGT
jgi:nitrite reductase (NADH) small subunit/3-phenylpropionate/trans-cinnamate dioxygenase ferredoxin subunit